MPLITSRTWIVLAGITLPTPAHHTDDLSGWLDGHDLRGKDVLVPFMDGEHPVAHRVAARTIQMRVTILGDRDVDGNVIADPELGLLTNLDTAVDAWTATDLVTVDVHRADGVVLSGQVRVYPNLGLSRVGVSWRAVVRCRLPAGVLT